MVFGTNAETHWEALQGIGYRTPIDQFFVRNHTSRDCAWRCEPRGRLRWGFPWRPRPGSYELRARAMDEHTAGDNRVQHSGSLFDTVVRHLVTVV